MIKLDWGNIWASITSKTGLIIIGLVGLLLLGWWLITAGESWYSTRQIDKLKANVNTALKAVNAAQANVQQDKIDEAVKLEEVKAATNQYVEAVNATDTARAETNRALTNLSNAVNANHPVNITADDLQKRLDELDK
jgi:seryl-tRNA synthetase